MVYLPNRTSSYRFTIDMNNAGDQRCLAALRATVSNYNKTVREGRKNDRFNHWAGIPLNRVQVRYRKPELNHPSNNTKYGWGGSVRKDQKPAKADVYVIPQ